jgi:hypothetical protein
MDRAKHHLDEAEKCKKLADESRAAHEQAHWRRMERQHRSLADDERFLVQHTEDRSRGSESG